MKCGKWLVVLALCALSPAVAEARWFGRSRSVSYSTNVSTQSTVSVSSVSSSSVGTAQGVANIMARIGRVGHFGGLSRGYEGCGMASTQAGAYNSCCYANSGMRTVDVGYARGSSGMWFCCRRYQ